ncbi:ABC transporter ATP-binding protein [Prochlorococcus marinus]|nr:ABC transporter ATP-binding protein [Prochlorococcus marinus]
MMKSILLRIYEISNLFNLITRKRKFQFLQLVVLSLISALIEILNISIIIPYLGSMANIQSNNALTTLSYIEKFIPGENFILIISLLMILSILISMFFRLVTLKYQFKLSTNIASDLGLRIFSKSLEMPYSWHQTINSSVLKGYITKDVDNVSEYVKGITFILVNSILIMVISSYLIFVYPLRTAILLSIISFLYLSLFFKIKFSLSNDGKIYSKKYQETLQIAEETYNNIDIIKLSNNFEYFKKKFNFPNKEFRNMSANINIKSQSPRYIIETFILVLIIAASLFIYSKDKDFQNEFIALGTIGLGSLKLLTPLQQFFNGVTCIQAYKSSFKKISNFLLKNNKLIKRSNKLFNMDKDIILEFLNVSFRYKTDDKYSLSKINLKIKQGQKIGVVGFSGSGKSTFAKLLMGLLVPNEGFIINENRNIFMSQSNLSNWQDMISYFPPDIYLIDGTILNNIAYGIEAKNIDKKKVIKSSKLSEIEEFVNSLPMKYLTKVGEKGSKLSAGQKQRIGISRGLYKEPKILVLDEALNSLDIKNELKIINNIFENFKHSTVILISHRLNSLKKCDQIIVFNDGSIQDIGNYFDLSKRNKLFNKLLSLEKE